jgi:hypothetical protein
LCGRPNVSGELYLIRDGRKAFARLRDRGRDRALAISKRRYLAVVTAAADGSESRVTQLLFDPAELAAQGVGMAADLCAALSPIIEFLLRRFRLTLGELSGRFRGCGHVSLRMGLVPAGGTGRVRSAVESPARPSDGVSVTRGPKQP